MSSLKCSNAIRRGFFNSCRTKRSKNSISSIERARNFILGCQGNIKNNSMQVNGSSDQNCVIFSGTISQLKRPLPGTYDVTTLHSTVDKSSYIGSFTPNIIRRLYHILYPNLGLFFGPLKIPSCFRDLFWFTCLSSAKLFEC